MRKNIFFILILFSIPAVLTAQYTNIGETGRITGVSNTWVVVNLKNIYYSNYIVIARPVSYNGSDPVVARISNKTTNSFMIRLKEPACNNGIHSAESVSYIVVKEGIWFLSDGRKIESHLFSSSATVGRGIANVWYSATFSNSYTSKPAVISMVQTYNDSNYVTTRHQNLDTIGFDVAMEEEENKTTPHGAETIGWIAIATGSGTNGNKIYEADNTPDAVNNNWYTRNFSENFSQPPELFAMMATYDGPDNAHLRYRNLTSSNVQIMVEEDTCNDSETGHTTEIVSYLLWEATTNIMALTGGYISISLGGNSPSQNLLQTKEQQEVFQIEITVSQNENITNVLLTLNANGSGNDSSLVVTNVKIWKDVNNNGFIDSSVDIQIDTNKVYSSDNGQVVFNVGTLSNSKTYNFLVTYDLLNANIGATYYIVVSNQNISGIGENSGNSPTIIGGPVKGIELNVIASYSGNGIGEVGRLINFGTNIWRKISLVNSYSNPVIITSVGSYNESEPCVARISNVQSNSFMLKLQEPANQDGVHRRETISYIAIEKGNWVLPDGTIIESGKTNISNTVGLRVTGGTWANIKFENNFSQPPIVVSSVMSCNDSHFVKTRHNKVYTTNFYVAMEEAENDTTQHGIETISYIVMSQGIGTHYNTKYEANRTPDLVTDSFYNQSFSQSYSSAPVVLNSMNTYDGNNNAETRISSPTTTSFNVKIEEDTTYDAEVAHTTEVVDFIVWESPCIIYPAEGNIIYVERGASSPAGNLLSYGNNQSLFQFKIRTGSKETITNVLLTLTAAGIGDDSSNTISLVQLYTDVNKNGYYDNGIDGFIDSGTYNNNDGTISFNLGSLPANFTNYYLVTYNINGANNGDSFCSYINYNGITGVGASSGKDAICANLPVTGYTLHISTAAGMGIGEVGVLLNWVNTNWKTVKFHRYYTTPVIITTPVSFNESDPVAVRIRNVTSSNFQLRLQEPSNNDGVHINETVSYMVIEKGTYIMPDGKRIIAGTLITNVTCGDTNPGQNFATVNFGYTFSSIPAVLHQVMSFNDSQWVKTRANGSTTSSFQVALEEEESQTGYHGTETIGWVAIESGTGNNNGILYEAGRTSTDVDEIWFTQNFVQTFSSPSIFLGVLDTVNGTDPCNCRYRNLNASSVELLGQEDTSADTEQNHNDEVAAYAVFESTGDIVGTTNLPVKYFLSSYSNTLTNSYLEPNQKNINIMNLTFMNTNKSGNDIQITGIYLHTKDNYGNDVIPSYVVGKVKITSINNSNVYTIKTNIENTGNELFIDLYPGTLIVPLNSSVTCNLIIDVTSNISATNIKFDISSNYKITGMDLFYSTDTTNEPYTGYNFPFETSDADLVKQFKISHDTLAITNEWEPIEIRVENYNASLITNYSGIITLDTLNGNTNTISWSNATGLGLFIDDGPNSDSATYQFVTADNGIVTLFIKDTSIETVNIEGRDLWISYRTNYLRFVSPEIKISLIKTVSPPYAKPYEILTYKISYSNTSIFDALNFSLVESLPKNVILITNSAEISNSPHSGNVSVYFCTNYTNDIWSNSNYDTPATVQYIRRIKWDFDTPLGSHDKGVVSFKVKIK